MVSELFGAAVFFFFLVMNGYKSMWSSVNVSSTSLPVQRSFLFSEFYMS